MTSIVARGRWAVLYAWLAAGAAAGATACATGGAAGAGVGSSMDMQFSGSPELAGRASLDAGGPPAAMVAATVLEVVSWPVLSVDTAQGALVSDWQYFEPAIRGSASQRFCQNPMALRFTVRKTPGGWAELTAEAYVPRSTRSGARGGGWDDSLVPGNDTDRRNALGQARGALASFRKAIVAATVDVPTASRALSELGQQLDNGSFRRCAGPQG